MNGNKAYSTKEKILLAQLVKDNDVVENKRTDGSTVNEKAKAWESISIAFNSQPEVDTPRSSGQLKKLWSNLKQRKRKETTALRHSMLLTGGGPPKKQALDPVLLMVEEAAPNLDVKVDCSWDSSAIFEEEQARTRSTSEEATDEVFIEEPVVVHRYPNQPTASSAASRVEDVLPLSLSVISEAAAQPSSQKKGVAVSLMAEKDARAKKAVDAMEQQEEIYLIRKEIAQEELRRAKVDLDTSRMRLRRETDEAELAALKLRLFKKQMLTEGHRIS